MAVTRKQAQEQLRKGGQTVFRTGKASISERVGYDAAGKPILERQTGAGMATEVHQLLDPRLDITDHQRAVGNCFGAMCEAVMAGGGGGDFMREFVDSSPMGGGGYSENQAHRARMVGCALDALKATPAFTYPRGRGRNCVMGSHNKVKPFNLAFQVCVNQRSLSFVALSHEWTRIPVVDGKFRPPVVPDRQRKALAEHLRTTIDVIGEAWKEGGYKVPYQFFTVVSRGGQS